MPAEHMTTKIENYLNRYMVFPEKEQSLAVALWILHTWTFHGEFPRSPFTTPYLYVHSAEKQSGKTQLIELIEPLALNTERASNMTSAVMFRMIDAVQPALLFDEVDAIYSGAKNEELRSLLNTGYKRGNYAWRMAPGDDGKPEPTKFSTYCPKLLAGIDNGKLPGTVIDRCLPIRLRRAKASEQREVYYDYEAGPIAEALVEEINEWILANGSRIISVEPKPSEDDGLVRRPFELARPLLQIAAADGRLVEARKALSRLLSSRDEVEEEGTRTLRAIRDLFEQRGNPVAIPAAEILEHLNLHHGKILAGILRPYGIGPSKNLRMRNQYVKSFTRQQFEDAWSRYID